MDTRTVKIGTFPGKAETYNVAAGSTVGELVALAKEDSIQLENCTIKLNGEVVSMSDTVVNGGVYIGYREIKAA